MRPSTLYFLLDEEKRSGYLDHGNVFWSTNPKALEFSPDGWSDVGVNNQRNSKYFALDRSFTIPLKFVEDGAKIIKNRYYKFGIRAKLSLLILKLKLHYDTTLNQYGWYYDLLYMGDIDFTQFKDEGTFVTVNVIEGGIPKYIKANENVKFEFDMTVLETILVKMDGVYLKEKNNWLIPQGVGFGNHLLGAYHTTTEGKAFGLAISNQNTDDNVPDFTNSPNYFFSSVQDITGLTISGSIKFHTALIGSYRLDLKTSSGRTINLVTNFAVASGTNYEKVFSVTFDASADERFFLVATATALLDAHYTETNFDIKFRSRYRATYAKAFRPNYLFSQLTKSVTDGNFSAKSNLLDAFENIVVLPGDSIRGIKKPILKTSFTDFFTSFNGRFGVGVGKLNNKVVMEKKADWVDYSDPIDLGEVSDQVVYPATDYLFNTWKFGSPEQDYSNVNGRNEFNNTFTFKDDITELSKECNFVSAYQMDCYGAEEIRINFDNVDLASSSSDNKVWMLHVKTTPIVEDIDGVPTTVYELDRSLNATATGLDEQDSVYNLFLSPKHCLLDNGSFIHSCFYKMDHTWLKFVTTEKNHSVTMIDNGKLIDEDGQEEIGSLDPQLFTPNMIEYRTQVPIDLLEILDLSPLKAFKWTYRGIPFMGIPVKNGIEPVSEDAQGYTMLSAPSNNLELLEEIFES
jgi:hypothetical protein